MQAAPPQAATQDPLEAESSVSQDKKADRERRREERERVLADKRNDQPAVVSAPIVEPEVVVPQTTGTFSVSGPIKKVRLRGDSGRLYGPGDVPPGRYNVLIPRGGKLERVLQIEIKAGEDRALKCNNLGCR